MRADVRPDTGWDTAVLARYEKALGGGAPLQVLDGSSAPVPFDVARWLRRPDAADETLLRRCTGPTLDVGCGPGRLTAALAARGIPALGVDVARTAVAIARACGAAALHRSVFADMPGVGRWEVVLLADGNIGIGGDVVALLRRLAQLLTPGGRALVEVDPGDTAAAFTARVIGPDGTVLGTFPWARIGAQQLVDLAVPLGYADTESWTYGPRAFVALTRCQR